MLLSICLPSQRCGCILVSSLIPHSCSISQSLKLGPPGSDLGQEFESMWFIRMVITGSVMRKVNKWEGEERSANTGALMRKSQRWATGAQCHWGPLGDGVHMLHMCPIRGSKNWVVIQLSSVIHWRMPHGVSIF